ncbi:MAG: hypothetical protein J1E36_02665 [Eubacterium sp.]|nr:hypothetical protein [Eubacterium sp.]
MKSIREHKCTGFFISVISFFIFISIILVPFSSLAVNTDLVYDPFGTSWIDKGEFIYLNNGEYFEGSLNYISDEDEGCFYLFFQFQDNRIVPTSSEKITLSFTVKNDVNTYKFQIDETGLLDNSSKNSFDAVDVYYNFDAASCGMQGGVIYAAFKLKNSTDRKLNNKISCEYFCGYNCNYTLFNCINLDMFVPTTSKDSSKTTTSKTTTKRNNTKITENSTSTKDNDKSSTKFAGSGKVSTTSQSNTKKFSSSQKTTQAQEQEIISSEEDSYFETIIDIPQNEAQDDNAQMAKSGMSRQAKLLLIIFAALFALGIVCVITGTLSGKKHEKHQG